MVKKRFLRPKYRNNATRDPTYIYQIRNVKPHICQGAASSWRLRPCSVLPCRRNLDCPASVQQPGQISFRDPMFIKTWHLPACDTLGGCRASQAGESNVFPSSTHTYMFIRLDIGKCCIIVMQNNIEAGHDDLWHHV